MRRAGFDHSVESFCRLHNKEQPVLYWRHCVPDTACWSVLESYCGLKAFVFKGRSRVRKEVFF